MRAANLHFAIGDVLWAELPQRLPPRHEQLGRRPVVVLAVPGNVQRLPFDMLLVSPVTSTSPRIVGPLFIEFPAGTGELPLPSVLLLDQLTSLDSQRIRGRLGTLAPDELIPVQTALRTLSICKPCETAVRVFASFKWGKLTREGRNGLRPSPRYYGLHAERECYPSAARASAAGAEPRGILSARSFT